MGGKIAGTCMKVDPKPCGFTQGDSLGDQTGDHPSEDIAHTARGHTGISKSAQRGQSSVFLD
jgi:hypothetical protein